MKKLFSIIMLMMLCMGASADNAKAILDQTAAIVGRKGGSQAQFTINGPKINAAGTIYIKGSKFCAKTNDATMWYDGTTQWTYLSKSNEVNVANPTASQQQRMNPYTFIKLYKKGYKLTDSKQGSNHVIHMEATGKASINELYITIDSSYHPTKVRMRQGSAWTTVVISNFQAKDQPDSMFKFNSKDFPKAEVIDLR